MKMMKTYALNVTIRNKRRWNNVVAFTMYKNEMFFFSYLENVHNFFLQTSFVKITHGKSF